jgi:Chaperone of endosialidase
MGRKNKNMLGGAASGASAGMAAGPWGAAAGAVIGGVLGSQQESDAQQLAPAIPQDVVDRLYRQSTGQEQTIGELKGAQMYDKTLAQQIAAAKAQRGVNPALLSRNVSRIAAEQSQANAQNAAILAAEERNQALAKYMQAQQLNSNIQAQNLGFERQADQQANNMMGAGINSLGASLAQQAVKQDAANQLESQKMDAELKDSSIQSQELAKSYAMGANQNAYTPQSNPASTPAPGSVVRGVSDERLKTKIKPQSLKMVSDERQKDLVSNENLPQNNNLGTQNMQAVQPSAPQQAPAPAMSMGQPAQATPQASQPQAQTAVPAPQAGITAEMLQQAQASSKRGGNVSDIKNASNSLTRAAAGPSQQEILDMTIDAQRRQTRDIFGNVTQSDAENYAANLARWQAAAQAQNAAFDKEQGAVDSQNLIKDATRTARLNRFYTGVDTSSTGAVASQYAPKVVTSDASWNSAPQAQAQRVREQQFAVNGPRSYSDENLKTDKKAEGSQDFNPKSFLDKLQAYSYEYKKGAKDMEGAGEGRHLSVMAQDLEKAGPVGKSMVEQDEQGNKVVDYGKGFGAILASQAQLNERLSQIEKMYSKKKKES